MTRQLRTTGRQTSSLSARKRQENGKPHLEYECAVPPSRIKFWLLRCPTNTNLYGCSLRSGEVSWISDGESANAACPGCPMRYGASLHGTHPISGLSSFVYIQSI